MGIKKNVFRFLKEINGNITYTTLKTYINNCGFMLILMHTPVGDAILKSLGIYEKCLGDDGKTYKTTEINIVVLNNDLSKEDKLRVLLHEIYHVINHNTHSIIDDTTDIQRENEAEAFAYEVLRLQKHKFLYSKTSHTIAISAVMCLLAVFIGIILISTSGKNIPTALSTVTPRAMIFSTPTVTPESTPIPQEAISPAEGYVYTLRKSEVYHKDNCYHLNINNALKLTISEAKSIGLRPCKYCGLD